MSVSLNKKLFLSRVEYLRRFLKNPVLIILGDKNDCQKYSKNSAMFLFLLNYELPNTCIYVTQQKVIFLCSKKKCEILQKLDQEIILCSDNFSINPLFKSIAIVDPNPVGEFVNEFISKHEDVSVIDCEQILSHKDETAVENLRVASKICAYLCDSIFKRLKQILVDKNQFNTTVSDIENYANELIEMNNDAFYDPMNVELVRFDLDCDSKYIVCRDHIWIDIVVKYNGYHSYISRVFYINSEPLEMDMDAIALKGDYKCVGLLEDEGKGMELPVAILVSVDEGDFTRKDVFLKKDTGYELLTETPVYSAAISKVSVRNRNLEYNTQKNIKRREHQIELMSKLCEEMVEYQPKDKISQVQSEIPTYTAEGVIPRSTKLIVDSNLSYVVIPIGNYSVPFHITAIKSILKLDNETIKISFMPKKTEYDSLLKCIHYKTCDPEFIIQQVLDLKKNYGVKKEVTPRVQRKFQLNCSMRSDHRVCKKKMGSLELLESGIRYIHDEELYFSFGNIESVFFQEANKEETRSMLHFKLVEPVQFFKPTLHIQFFIETGSGPIDTSSRRDETTERYQEAEEIKNRENINLQLKSFGSKLQSLSGIQVELPAFDMKFSGIPGKSTVFIMPTQRYLVDLSEPPFFIQALESIEVFCFERLIMGVKKFDLTLVLRDKTVRFIRSVDFSLVDKIKDWIDSRGLCYIECRFNLNWSEVLKCIVSDLKSFYEKGGWSELQPDVEDESEGTSSEASVEDTATTSSEDELTSEDSNFSKESAEYSGSESDSSISSDSTDSEDSGSNNAETEDEDTNVKSNKKVKK